MPRRMSASRFCVWVCARAALAVFAMPAHAGVSIEHWVAPSGARVYFVASKDLPVLDVSVAFPAGSAYDPPEKAGVATLTRALLDGGAGGLDEEGLAERIADTAAQLSGTTDADRTAVSLRTLSSPREREASLALMANVLARPDFPAKVLERERARMIAGIRESDTRPDGIGARTFQRALYPNHPYGVSPRPESVSRIQRADLVEFHRKHYVASGAVVSLVGAVTRGEAERIADQLTSGLPRGDTPAVIAEPTMPVQARQDVANPATQSHVFVGMPSLKRGDPDFFALVLGNYILGGGGFVSRLTDEVREKRGLSYSVYSYFEPRKALGPFSIGLQTRREQAAQALEVVNETLRKFLAEGPTEAEIQAAKRNLVGGFALRLDSNRKILDHVSVIGFYGLPLDYLDTYQSRIQSVTAEDIRAAFSRHVKPEHLVTVVVAGG